MGVAMIGNLFSKHHFQIVAIIIFVHAVVVGVPVKMNYNYFIERACPITVDKETR